MDFTEGSQLRVRLKLPEWAIEILCCPICGNGVTLDRELKCLNKECASVFPVVDGIPVLLNGEKSIFSAEDFINHKNTYYGSKNNSLTRILFNIAPKISANIKAKENFRKLADLLLEMSLNPKVLVLGGSMAGAGMAEFLSNPSIEFLETDVSFGPRTMAIVDAHCIPFKDNSFQCVVIQAVLEHVIDPYMCVKEIHRVLKREGIVYAETAFMQQVHGGKFDFTRFTYLGHRRLFAQFLEIDSGAVCGTGMALAWAYQYFLMSLIKSSTFQIIARLFARLTAFWLKYFDYLTIDNPCTLEGASGYYFFGQKSKQSLEDSEQ